MRRWAPLAGAGASGVLLVIGAWAGTDALVGWLHAGPAAYGVRFTNLPGLSVVTIDCGDGHRTFEWAAGWRPPRVNENALFARHCVERPPSAR